MHQPLNGRVYKATLRKKCPYSELFWSKFSHMRTEYGGILRISPYSIRMRENADQNNCEYGDFPRSANKIGLGYKESFYRNSDM